MHRTERHDLYVANGSRGSRTEVHVTSVNGSVATSSSGAQDPKQGVSKFGVRKVAYRRKAPITLGSVKDWPIETPTQPEESSQYGRIDLSKMTIDSSSTSRGKVHKINVETSSGVPVDSKSPIFKGVTVRKVPSQENRNQLLSCSKASTSPIKDSSLSFPANKTQNVIPIKVVPTDSSSISTKASDVQKSPASNIREKSKVSFDHRSKSDTSYVQPKEAPKSPQTPERPTESSKPATFSSTPARTNNSQSPIPSKETPESLSFQKDTPKSSNLISDFKPSSTSTKGSSKEPSSPSRNVPAARDNKAPSLSPSRNVPATKDNKAPSLSPSRDVPAARDNKAPSTASPKRSEPLRSVSPSRSNPLPSTNKDKSSFLPQQVSSKQSSTKPDTAASTKNACSTGSQSGSTANTSKIPNEVVPHKEPTLRKQPSANLPKITFQDDVSEPEFKPRNVVIKENKPVKQWYSVDETLGSGKFGVVRLGRDKETDMKCAIKFIPIGSEEERESVLTEIQVMVKLQHPRLIQLLDAFMSKDEAALVMEVISGGELFERIIDDNFELTESKCVQFMREVCEGVKFIHEQHVIHLDLKPENILCLNRTGFKIKIIDFGLARFWRFGEPLRVMFGTPEFVAPEILAYDEVSHLTDMWSVGVICYVLLSGLSPFMGDSDRETYINITKAKFSFDYPEFKEISADARNFVTQLLVKEMRNRMTAEEALNHRWLQKRTSLKRTGTVSKRALRRFVYRRKWQKAKNIIVALLRMGVTLTQR